MGGWEEGDEGWGNLISDGNSLEEQPEVDVLRGMQSLVSADDELNKVRTSLDCLQTGQPQWPHRSGTPARS